MPSMLPTWQRSSVATEEGSLGSSFLHTCPKVKRYEDAPLTRSQTQKRNISYFLLLFSSALGQSCRNPAAGELSASGDVLHGSRLLSRRHPGRDVAEARGCYAPRHGVSSSGKSLLKIKREQKQQIIPSVLRVPI